MPVVWMEGLEPTRLVTLPPEDRMLTNFITFAVCWVPKIRQSIGACKIALSLVAIKQSAIL